MSSLHTMTYGLLGNSSEIVVAAAFLFTIIAGCVFTYLFGFSSNSATNGQDEASSSANEEKKSKEKKPPKKSSTSTTTTTTTAAATTNSANLKKEEPPKVLPKKTAKLSAAPIPSAEPSTTKSKKSPPTKVGKETVVVQTKAPQLKAPQSTTAAAEVMSADDGWITVVDKKQKKSPSITEINATIQATVVAGASVAASNPKNTKKKDASKQVQQTEKAIEFIPSESEVLQDVVVSNDVQEDDWIPANSKVSKKNSKTKATAIAPSSLAKAEPVVSKIVEQSGEMTKSTSALKQEKPIVAAAPNDSVPVVVESPKANNKKKAKKDVVKTQEPAIVAVQALATSSVAPPATATKMIPVEKIEKPAAPLTLPKNATREEIQAAMIQAIIEANTNSGTSTTTNTNDINNNTNAKANKKVTGADALAIGATTTAAAKAVSSTTSSKSTKSSSSNSLNMPNLKQTNLSESMILIEKDNQLLKSQTQSPASSSKSKSSRTESNQSSSDSLQDVEGDVEGFITITNKKAKKPVRREN